MEQVADSGLEAAPDKGATYNTRQLVVRLNLEITPDFVTELARDHKIPAFKDGSRWRFRSDDVARIRQEIRKYLALNGGQ